MTELERLRSLAAAANKKRESALSEAVEIASLKQQIAIANDSELTALLAASQLASANLNKIKDIKAKVVEAITSTTNYKGEVMQVYNSHNYEFSNPLLREVLSLATAAIYTSPLIKGQIEAILSPINFLDLESLVSAAGRLPYWNSKKFTMIEGFKADISKLRAVFKTILAKLDLEASSFITPDEYDALYSAAEEKAKAEELAYKKQAQLANLIKTI